MDGFNIDPEIEVTTRAALTLLGQAQDTAADSTASSDDVILSKELLGLPTKPSDFLEAETIAAEVIDTGSAADLTVAELKTLFRSWPRVSEHISSVANELFVKFKTDLSHEERLGLYPHLDTLTISGLARRIFTWDDLKAPAVSHANWLENQLFSQFGAPRLQQNLAAWFAVHPLVKYPWPHVRQQPSREVLAQWGHVLPHLQDVSISRNRPQIQTPLADSGDTVISEPWALPKFFAAGSWTKQNS